MLKIPDDVSEILFNVIDKVCITFGARKNSASDGELTDQNLNFFFDPLIVYAFVAFTNGPHAQPQSI